MTRKRLNETPEVTMNDLIITSLEARAVKNGFVIDGINSIDHAELVVGKADIYAADSTGLLSAYWFTR